MHVRVANTATFPPPNGCFSATRVKMADEDTTTAVPPVVEAVIAEVITIVEPGDEPAHVPRPNKDALDVQIAEINKTIAGLEEKREQLKNRIDGAKKSSEEVNVRTGERETGHLPPLAP